MTGQWENEHSSLMLSYTPSIKSWGSMQKKKQKEHESQRWDDSKKIYFLNTIGWCRYELIETVAALPESSQVQRRQKPAQRRGSKHKALFLINKLFAIDGCGGRKISCFQWNNSENINHTLWHASCLEAICQHKTNPCFVCVCSFCFLISFDFN